MALHVFVIMPFGEKEGINFDSIYGDYIKPALEGDDFEVFRADEERRAGEIRTDMFQELLLADLVVADLSIDNPNVWYELGVRHALRARGIVLIQSRREKHPFDIYTDRKLRYHILDGVPDPAFLEGDKASLATMAKETVASWHGRKISPVYQLLPNLREPDWKSLRIGDVGEFWERYEAWEDRIVLARKEGLAGDILVLADEAPVYAFRSAAWIRAGEALRKAGRFEFALEQLERGLAIEPHNLKCLQEKGICLQRLANANTPGYTLDRARNHYCSVLKKYPGDPETCALLGRIDKDAWIKAWRRPGKTPQQMREDACYEEALLGAAIASYKKAFRGNPGHYYSGINALTLMHVLRHLNGDTGNDREMAVLAGAVRFAAECEPDQGQLFWSKASLGDLEVLVGTPATVKAAYKEAIAKNKKDWFALKSCRSQLKLLEDLGFQPANVQAGIATFDRALQNLKAPLEKWEPRQVILFSGHMIDAPGRPSPRFPNEIAPVAAQKIGDALDRFGAGPDDLAFTQGACGGDLLFSKACLERGVKVNWLQPFSEPDFIQNSVVRGGVMWRQRYYQAKERLAAPIRCAPDALGPPPPNSHSTYPYERCNLWLLYTALAHGVKKVRFLCLWNGEGGDGPGGTAHMYNEVNRRTGRVTWIDIRKIK
jgi:tetratricopeptide (TPR) repeat protein